MLSFKKGPVKICIKIKAVQTPEWRSSADDPSFVPISLGYLRTPEEAVVFHTLFPHVLTLVSVIKIELHDVLVITL